MWHQSHSFLPSPITSVIWRLSSLSSVFLSPVRHFFGHCFLNVLIKVKFLFSCVVGVSGLFLSSFCLGFIPLPLSSSLFFRLLITYLCHVFFLWFLFLFFLFHFSFFIFFYFVTTIFFSFFIFLLLRNAFFLSSFNPFYLFSFLAVLSFLLFFLFLYEILPFLPSFLLSFFTDSIVLSFFRYGILSFITACFLALFPSSQNPIFLSFFLHGIFSFFLYGELLFFLPYFTKIFVLCLFCLSFSTESIDSLFLGYM